MRQFVKYLSLIATLCNLPLQLQASTVQVTDDRQITTTLPTAPQRIAAISIFAADLMVKLNQPVVALSTRNNSFPPYLQAQLDQPVNLGAAHETNLELLTKAKPDLTIGIKTYTLPVAKKIEEVAPFLAFDFTSWADSDRAIRLSSKALHQEAQGLALNQQFRQQIQSFKTKIPADHQHSTLLLWVWADSPVGFYSNGHLTTELIDSLNIRNAMGESAAGQISEILPMEKLLLLDPDSILVFQGDDADLPYHPVWEQLSAYKNNSIYRISDQYVEPHGPIARDFVLRELAHIYYPQLFAQPQDIPVAARAKPARWAAKH